MTLPDIFSILNNVSIRKNICLTNKPLFWQKRTPDVSSHFWPPCWCPLRWAPTWRLHTKLYKFVWNIMSNNSSTEYRTDLRLGQIPYLFILYSVYFSWIHSLNGFWFLFWWRDSENRQFLKTTSKRTEYHSLVISFCNLHCGNQVNSSVKLVNYSVSHDNLRMCHKASNRATYHKKWVIYLKMFVCFFDLPATE